MLTIISLVLVVIVISLLIQSALLFGISRLFKITATSFKKSMFTILWTVLAQIITLLFFILIGLTVVAPLFVLVVAIIVFCCSLKHYYQVSWGKSIGIYFINLVVGGIATALLIVIPVRLFLAEPFIVTGSSMSPHLNQDDGLIVEKFDRNFKRDDVVIFKMKTGNYLIKRIIGLPNEHVTLSSSTLSINGTPLKDPYLVGQLYVSSDVTLESDEYYVLGDNLVQSADSRVFGPIKATSIMGKVAINFGKM